MYAMHGGTQTLVRPFDQRSDGELELRIAVVPRRAVNAALSFGWWHSAIDMAPSASATACIERPGTPACWQSTAQPAAS